LSEAVQQGLPVLTVRNTWTMPQERYNTDWVQHNGLGLVVRSMRKVRPAVLEMLSRLDEFKQRVGQIENQAVFEVPDILAGILDRRAAAAS
jgi:1,2-diacylglycerol 3-beta-galactosyltransferase